MADEHEPKRVYLEQIKSMRELDLCTLYVDFTHLLDREEVLAKAITDFYYRCVGLLRGHADVQLPAVPPHRSPRAHQAA